MGLFHQITIFLVSEEEKASFLEAGIEFTEATRGPRGESVIFEIGEDDPRWERVVALTSALEGRGSIPKEYRVQNLTMTAPTMKENLRQTKERVASYMKLQRGLKWLDGYSGESIEQLLSLDATYRTDSLVLAFEQGINQKAEREGARRLTMEERIVVAVESLEREVNNGGYDQFFVNSSREFAPIIVDALQRIGCKEIANITQKAIEALGISDLKSDTIEAIIRKRDEKRRVKLSRCDDAYYKSTEPIAERLFAFIKANKASISF